MYVVEERLQYTRRESSEKNEAMEIRQQESRGPKRTHSLKKSNSFKIKRMGNIIVCDCCGQGHQPGKNHLYDYPDNTEDELLCGICLQPLVDPVDTPCGHTFCYICLKGHMRMQKNCPADQQLIKERDIKPSSMLVRKILDKLMVVCPNNGYCDQVMARSSLEVHLKYHCPGSYVSCPRGDSRSGCDYIGPRCQLEDHLWCCCYGSDIDRKTGCKLPVVEGQVTVIEIPKGTSDMGLSISWCDDEGVIIIDDIFPEGNAYRDGRLCIGDRILEINDENFTNRTLAEATLALSGVVPLIRLAVLREYLDEYSPDPELIEIPCDDETPLGIQIRSSPNRPGVFIHQVLPGSHAEQCGLLHSGDRVLEANGHDLKFATLDDAATIMSQVSGNLKLLISHSLRTFPASDLSSSGTPSSTQSQASRQHYHHHHQHHHQYQQQLPNPIYAEIVAPTGFKVGEQKCIVLRKQPDESFGMSVGGGKGSEEGDLPIYVSDLRPDSVVGKCGQIQKGDIILKINDIVLLEKEHVEAIQLIRGIMAASTIRLEMIQGDDTDEDGSLSPDWVKWMQKYKSQSLRNKSPMELDVTLARNGSESLGFSLVGGVNSSRGNSPVYVRSITPGGLAAGSGKLQPGDEILRINGHSLDNMSQDEVVKIIRNISGSITLTINPRDVML